MNYLDARPQIRTGDLIAIRSRHGGLPALTRWVTRSPVTHTGVAVWAGYPKTGRLLIAESKGGGAALAPLSQYEGVDFDVYACPLDEYPTEVALWRLLGSPIDYDLIDLFRIAANKLFRVPLPPLDDGRFICSALSAAIYREAGWRPVRLPSIPAPSDVVAAFAQAPKLQVRGG